MDTVTYKESANRVVTEVIAPSAANVDRQAQFPRRSLDALAKAGLLEEDKDWVMGRAILARLGWTQVSTAVRNGCVGAGPSLVSEPLPGMWSNCLRVGDTVYTAGLTARDRALQATGGSEYEQILRDLPTNSVVARRCRRIVARRREARHLPDRYYEARRVLARTA